MNDGLEGSAGPRGPVGLRFIVIGLPAVAEVLESCLGSDQVVGAEDAMEAVGEAAVASDAGRTPVVLIRAGSPIGQDACGRLAKALRLVAGGAVLLCEAASERLLACHGVFDERETPAQLIERLEVMRLTGRGPWTPPEQGPDLP